MQAAEQIRRTVRGAVHVPGDAGYDRERAVFDALTQRPAVVVEARDAADVRAAIVAAQEHRLPFAVQATGHGTQVLCDGGLLLKTGGLGGVLVDPHRRVARVGAGVTWAQVVAAAAPFGLVPVMGSHASVGVAGYTLGGGVGWLSRRFGYGADNLLAAEVVTAAGRWLRVDADHHADLFWALRGGGGNFAVVTALELRLHPVARVVAGTLTFARDRGADLLAALAADRPDRLSASVVLRRDAVVVRAVHTGAPDEAARDLAPLRRAGGSPVADDLAVVRAAAASPGGTAPRHFELLRALPVDALLAAADRADAVEVRHWGGAMARSTVPAGHRDVPFSVTVDGGPDALAPLRGHVTGGTFRNFLHDQARTADAYTAADLAWLRAIKQAWDPENVLGRTHNIAPYAAQAAAA